MPDSGYIFIEGEAIQVGNPGDHDFEFSQGESVVDAGDSDFVFVEGTGMGGGIIIDDFEDGDLSEYFGDNGISISSSAAYEGSYGIAIPDGANPLVSTSGLDTYPSQGDTWRWNVNNNGSSAHFGHLFGVQDTNNFYSADTDNRPGTTENGIQIQVHSGGDVVQKYELETGNIPNNEWMECEMAWGTDDSLTFTVYDSSDNQLGQINATDSTYTDGGVGYRSAGHSGQDAYLDFVRKVA